MDEFERMSLGKLYDPNDPSCLDKRKKAHKLCFAYNALEEDDPKRLDILKRLCPNAKEGLYLQGPIYFDYGLNTHFGKNVYANFSFYCLDVCPVYIGDDVMMGCSVHLMTPVHPTLYEERKAYFDKDKGYWTDKEYAKPIIIENGVWIASNVTVCGGVRIGEGSIIGAGSVVTRDIPPHVFAAGNPCKVIRPITPQDSIKFKKELL